MHWALENSFTFSMNLVLVHLLLSQATHPVRLQRQHTGRRLAEARPPEHLGRRKWKQQCENCQTERDWCAWPWQAFEQRALTTLMAGKLWLISTISEGNLRGFIKAGDAEPLWPKHNAASGNRSNRNKSPNPKDVRERVFPGELLKIQKRTPNFIFWWDTTRYHKEWSRSWNRGKNNLENRHNILLFVQTSDYKPHLEAQTRCHWGLSAYHSFQKYG